MSAKIPAVDVELMRASDAATIANVTPDAVLMDRAGRGIAELCTSPGPYAIICGPGNNGGDGYVCARYLAERGESVTVFFTKEPSSESSCYHRGLIDESKISVQPFENNIGLSKFGTIIDCLLGTGFSGVPRGTVAEAIEAINAAPASGTFVVSADINSGINGDTGQGELAVRSNLTVSIGYFKIGMFEPTMEAYAERIANVDIGILLADKATRMFPKTTLPKWIDSTYYFINDEGLQILN